MKIALILLVAVAATLAAPVDEAAKTKRGLSLGYGYHGYHAPLVTHSHYVAPAVVHHAPLISHAPLIAHAPILTHHPVSYHLPSYHTIHHLK